MEAMVDLRNRQRDKRERQDYSSYNSENVARFMPLFRSGNSATIGRPISKPRASNQDI